MTLRLAHAGGRPYGDPVLALAIVAIGLTYIGGRWAFRRKHQQQAANASGLSAVADLTHLPPSLQQTALWSLADGGFESRVVHGVLSRGAHDIDVTAFDLATLRDRRGEWAWLPIDPPFRIGGLVSVVACEADRSFPHILFKRAGRGDEMLDDDLLDRGGSVAKLARDGLGLPRSYAAELPIALPATALDVELPDQWRVYSAARDRVTALLAAGFAATLDKVARRDLVIELYDALVLVYPAARDVVGADAFADLTTTALVVADGVYACSPALSPRGVEAQRP